MEMDILLLVSLTDKLATSNRRAVKCRLCLKNEHTQWKQTMAMIKMKTNVLINAHDSLFLKTKYNGLWSQGEKKKSESTYEILKINMHFRYF